MSVAKFFFTCGVALLLAASSALALDPKDESVLVSAAVSASPASIALHWEPDAKATGYTISRKLLTAAKWTSLARLPRTAEGYLDLKVQPGMAYEYRIVKSASGYTGYGFILSGIEIPFLENSGKIILVVDETYATELATELTRLIQDLIGDGWTVIRRDVARTASVVSVKNMIKAEYNADRTNVKAVFLFGHVPVPYSGNFNPDGHGDHRGAWPADAFYGDMDGVFTDRTVNNLSPTRAENKNIPGDGKFDQSLIASVELQVGRVDLANMPGLGKSEVELLRQYLEKDHKFRQKQMEVVSKGLIDDHFGVNTSGEAFAVNGWRNFSPLIGASNTVAANWMATLSTQNYLWAYACSGGDYDGAGGIAETADYAAYDLKGVFTMLLGSYFGDWDSTDNFLRAPLGGATSGLISAWAGRPNWYFHPMGLGKTTGYCARFTQNNSGVYPTGSSPRQPHIALMGDPTLRMHPVAPPTDFTAARNSSGGVDLNWTASADAVEGYYLYAAPSPAGPFTALNGTIISGTSFSHASNPTGKTYMVRAVKLESSPSGSYFNPSQGVFFTFGGETVQPPTGLPVITVTATDATASEQGPDAGAITITRSGSTAASLQVSLSVNGSATNGDDYEAIPTIATIPAGSASTAISVTPVADGFSEGSEDIVLSLLEDDSYVLGDPSSASIEITDTTVTTDSSNPVVTITSPRAGSSVTKTVKIAVSATDNVGVIQTDLLIDDAAFASSTSSNPTFNWDTKLYPPGQHILKALAHDLAGNVGTSSVVVTVKAQ